MCEGVAGRWRFVLGGLYCQATKGELRGRSATGGCLTVPHNAHTNVPHNTWNRQQGPFMWGIVPKWYTLKEQPTWSAAIKPTHTLSLIPLYEPIAVYKRTCSFLHAEWREERNLQVNSRCGSMSFQNIWLYLYWLIFEKYSMEYKTCAYSTWNIYVACHQYRNALLSRKYLEMIQTYIHVRTYKYMYACMHTYKLSQPYKP